MNIPLRAVVFVVILAVATSVFGADAATPNGRKTKWEFSEPRPLGDRQASAGFQIWGPRPLLLIMVSAKDEDKKPIPISRLKVTVLDNKGKPLAVTSHYQDGLFQLGREQHTAFFQVGTFVQNVQPEEISQVTIVGFGGKVTMRFVGGNARKEQTAK